MKQPIHHACGVCHTVRVLVVKLVSGGPREVPLASLGTHAVLARPCGRRSHLLRALTVDTQPTAKPSIGDNPFNMTLDSSAGIACNAAGKGGSDLEASVRTKKFVAAESPHKWGRSRPCPAPARCFPELWTADLSGYFTLTCEQAQSARENVHRYARVFWPKIHCLPPQSHAESTFSTSLGSVGCIYEAEVDHRGRRIRRA
jgi:hypothetical protein